ncbi:diaminohydroxyphosphoribosylaminopyrimidine deaminase [Butyrivibrio fibrisolvens DSM 3071]|uniref:Riboflavin biosynthesis protein RibD n=2 Tax=Butyrivibrio fibrisolvens TaxID=831 RepID=A0A1M6G1P8_BUTFI|nr:bifunctional diaminohydroxyphosphoribosylaminopyrimidine deaminase/5-amino-6-(5-phosphoribosylamino)uracil reductase RibD [Butyrivibrio fibrisolvens]SHJ03797.1 diaminohydroxyphosphoribosylaminopyrimidine deaminase [Butyrivibrio fibrisolvens DSM 3071]
MNKELLDPSYMRRAIELALTAKGHTNPNPLVGAVIVKDGRVIGEGCHQKYGDLHAERNAIKSLNESAEGATIYVTLEPCCHYGKQPPCTLAIVEAGISRVVIGSRDPNPLVSGKGTAYLREHGIEVIEDYLRDECDEINPVFFHYISRKEPYVALKYAMTADGRIATDKGSSKWITGESARSYVHELRSTYTGILAGIGTVLADDPLLTCRIPGGRNPVRIVMDSHLNIPLDCNLVKTADQGTVIVACLDEYTKGNDQISKVEKLKSLGVQVLGISPDSKGEHICVKDLLKKLGNIQIDGILVEGGKHINAAFLSAGKVNKIYTFVGNKIVGGKGAFTPVDEMGIEEMKDSVELSNPKVRTFDTDILIEYDVENLRMIRAK